MRRKRERKTRKIKARPAKSLMREADRVFSLWIRKRDGRCICCGTKERLQNGHLVKRGVKSLRFDEKNCNAQCSGCNFRHNYRPDVYEIAFIQRYGLEEFHKLLTRSTEVKKWTYPELQGIIQKYSSAI